MKSEVRAIIATIIILMMLSFFLGWICSWVYYNPGEVGMNVHEPLEIYRMYRVDGRQEAWTDYGRVVDATH